MNKPQASLKKHRVTRQDLFVLLGSQIKHEFDDYGNHRLIVDGRFKSDWTSYLGICKIKTRKGTFYGVSEYYAGTLPAVFVTAAEALRAGSSG